MLHVKRLDELATIPTRGSERSAGYDLYSNEHCVIPPQHSRALVKTGISIKVPAGHYGRIAPRSGLAVKYGIDVGAGVIDEDYRGEIAVLLFNFGDEPFSVKPGDRIAQLVLERNSIVDVCEVESLDSTDRGEGGFGSTGV
jgi:dUTP pyrophosphatase